MGVLYFEGGKIIPYISMGEDLCRRVVLHFGEKLGKDAL